jgi:membrane protease YdiL (CAAX protease family)
LRSKIGFSLIILVLLEILIIQIMLLFFNLSPYLTYAFITTGYLVIALLVWLERRRLDVYHLDSLTLFAVCFSSVSRRRLGVTGEGYFLFLIGAAGIVIFAVAIMNRSLIPRTNLRWAIIGIFIGCLSLIPITILESFEAQEIVGNTSYPYNMILVIIRGIIYQLSFVAPIEEILFRGLLWGFLSDLNWSENKIVWWQGILFWMMHFSRIGTPIALFFTIPLLTIISSQLVLRSRQVSPAILSHTIINTITPIFLSAL